MSAFGTYIEFSFLIFHGDKGDCIVGVEVLRTVRAGSQYDRAGRLSDPLMLSLKT